MVNSDDNATSSASGQDSNQVIFNKSDCLEDVWDDAALIRAYDRAVNLTYDAVTAAIHESGDELQSADVSKSKLLLKDDKVKKGNRKKTKRAGRRVKKLSVGDLCLAPYAEDDDYYHALIISMDKSQDSCTVQFLGYDDLAQIPISSLHKYDRRRALALTRRRISSNRTQEKARKRIRCISVEEDGVSASTDVCCSRSMNRSDNKRFRPTVGAVSNPGSSDDDRRVQLPILAPPPPPGYANFPPPSNENAVSSMLMSWYMSGYHTGYYQALQDAKKNEAESGKK